MAGRGRDRRLRPAPDPDKTAMILRCGKYSCRSNKPRVMGVVNVTPDSFSDAAAFRRTRRRRSRPAAGSMRGRPDRHRRRIDAPRSAPVSEEEEMRRLIPVLEGYFPGDSVSVDTRRPRVMKAALAAGASMISRRRGRSTSLGALQAVAEAGAPCASCTRKASRRRCSATRNYDDVLGEVKAFVERIG